MTSKSASKQLGLVWFRSDLRTRDNPALYAACQECRQVLAVFMVPRQQWNTHGLGANRQWFTLKNLSVLRDQLGQLNIPLLVVETDTYKKSAAELERLHKEHGFSDLYYNSELEVNESTRDSACRTTMANLGVQCHAFNDQTLANPGSVRTKEQQYFKVFTPFKKALISQIHSIDIDPLPEPNKVSKPIKIAKAALGEIPAQQPTCKRDWQAGQQFAYRELQSFTESAVYDYKALRDFPAQDNTSRLSPYLAVGALSLRQCFYEALKANNFSFADEHQGVACWINELIWREFYKHLVVGFPHVCKHRAFNREYARVPWRKADTEFKAWCDGKTGYPIVDAAMKQLVHEGWMHNRLRMVVAMFLTKHLLIDWRRGEAFFLKHLVDADFAANNGGWQWSASTGADAAPYFRIFNPIRQSERFDPDGQFIKRYLPQLEGLNPKSIHSPSPMEAEMSGYPKAIIEHKFAVERAKTTFRTAKEQQPRKTEHAL